MLKKLLKVFRKDPILLAPPKNLSEEDYNIIYQYSIGKLELRSKAIEVYRRALQEGIPPRSSTAMCYMAEVDNSIPDYSLKFDYKLQLLREHGSK